MNNLKSGVTLDGGSVLRFNRARFGICCIPKGKEGRQVFQGPMVPGPWAATYELAGVIDCNGGSARESREMTAAGREVEVHCGDVVCIDGYLFRVDSKEGFDSRIPVLTYLSAAPVEIGSNEVNVGGADGAEEWFPASINCDVVRHS